MTAQPSLFDVSLSGRVRRTDPQTSLDAARTVSGRTVTLIHGAFLAGPTSGMTDSELCAVLPLLYGPTVISARSRLSGRGVLVDSGMRRPSNRGRLQIVWILA